jgi:excisionase family DNA binding protein
MTSALLHGTITTEEAAKYLGISVPTLKRWRAENIGPPYQRIGPKLIRYKESELDRWLAAQSSD